MAIKKQKLGPGTLTIGETGSGQEMAKQSTAVAIEPSYSDGDRQIVLSGDVDQEAAEWEGTLTATFFQDYDAAGLLAWTWEHDGETLPFTFLPNSASGFEVSGEVVIRPATIGGDVDAENTSEVEWSLPKRPAIGEPGTTAQAFRAGAQSATVPTVTEPETDPEYSV